MELIFLRHGQSLWNLENRFTGWSDVDLSERGISEAHQAAVLLKKENWIPNMAFTSYLKRANRTLDITLKDMELEIPVEKAWQLNERHYGALQGLNKKETSEKYGADQVHQWRRGFEVLPPLVEKDSEYYPGNDPKYADVSKELLPLGESLALTIDRVIPYWEKEILPQVKAGKKVIIAAHGNSLRALVKYLFDLSEEEIMTLNIPTGIPMKVTLNEAGKGVEKTYFGNPEEAKKAAAEVANQSK